MTALTWAMSVRNAGDDVDHAAVLQCIGKTGEVVSFAANGAVGVKFDKISYRFNAKTITKVTIV